MEKTCEQCKCIYTGIREAKSSFCSSDCRYKNQRLKIASRKCRGCNEKLGRIGTGYKYCEKCTWKRQELKMVNASRRANAAYKKESPIPIKRTEQKVYFPDRDTSCDGSQYV